MITGFIIVYLLIAVAVAGKIEPAREPLEGLMVFGMAIAWPLTMFVFFFTEDI